MTEMQPLTEKEIRQLFVDDSLKFSKPLKNFFGPTRKNLNQMVRPRRGPGIKEFFKYALALLFILVVVFAAVNGPSYYSKIRYWWKVDYRGGSITDQNIFGPVTTPGNVPIPDNGTTTPSAQSIDLSQSKLYVPKINVTAPIIWNVSQEQILTELKKGVAHYQGSALPGQVGNVFITGHSSNYWWDKGNYNHIFALLDKLVVGDEVYLIYNQVIYKYQVTSAIVVTPTDVSVLESQGQNTLSLMTCVPVGTALNRLVIRGNLVSPDTTKAAVTGQDSQEDLIQELIKIINK